MLAIGLLFVRMLCDSFKPRPRLEVSETVVRWHRRGFTGYWRSPLSAAAPVVAATMSFTALDGLPMSRRCGNLEPGVVLYLDAEILPWT